MSAAIFMVLLKVVVLAIGLFLTVKAWRTGKPFRAAGTILATMLILLLL